MKKTRSAHVYFLRGCQKKLTRAFVEEMFRKFQQILKK